MAQLEDKAINQPRGLDLAQPFGHKQRAQDTVVALEHLGEDPLIPLVFANEGPQLGNHQTAMRVQVLGYNGYQIHCFVQKTGKIWAQNYDFSFRKRKMCPNI